MRRIRSGLLAKSAALAGAMLVSSFSLAWAEEVQIFNGKDFSNWYGRETTSQANYDAFSQEQKDALNATIAKHWKIEGDEIVNDGHGAFLSTKQDFADFDFSFDYKIVKDCDSGIYLRGIPQVQIWDTKSPGSIPHGADKGSGGLWNNPKDWPGKDPLVLADNPTGEWNSMKIRLIGERCSVWLNGKLVVDNARLHNFFAPGEPLPKAGPIQLQTHGGEIRFRNLKLETHDAEAANKLLQEASDKAAGDNKFVPLFNGKDFTGWAGAVDNYTIVDGSIQCLKGKGGTLYTEKTYADFVARVEFKLPPAGNNGLAIRYPSPNELDGGTDPAYVGMTELQVLDDGHPSYANIDPRQRHGSVYGIVAAKPGYLRPVGEWNYQIVKVEGSRITVELNGTTILDADIADINEFMANTPHPGKDRKSGHFGFAGHSDEVQFKNVEIQTLK